jgi:hypothetical protein
MSAPMPGRAGEPSDYLEPRAISELWALSEEPVVRQLVEVPASSKGRDQPEIPFAQIYK